MQNTADEDRAAALPEDVEKGLPSPALSSGSTLTSSALLFNAGQAIRKIWTWRKNLGQMPFKPTSKKQKAKRRKYICKVRKLEDYALGYPKLAAFFHSDDQFSVYRRFGYVYSRLLLYKQDELRELECDLQTMDDLDFKGNDTKQFLKCREEDDRREGRPVLGTRRSLLRTIEKKALEYGALLEQAQKLVAMNKPPKRDCDSVWNFMQSNRPLLAKDGAFIKEKEDLITLRPGRETSFVDAFVERMLQKCHCKTIQNIFASEETRAKTTDDDIRYFTRSRINLCVTLIITCIILILLVLPIWLLYHVTVTLDTNRSNSVCIGVLLVSTLVFSAVLSLFTKARRHEILAASAGYCAVLVVFVGNIGNAGISSVPHY